MEHIRRNMGFPACQTAGKPRARQGKRRGEISAFFKEGGGGVLDKRGKMVYTSGNPPATITRIITQTRTFSQVHFASSLFFAPPMLARVRQAVHSSRMCVKNRVQGQLGNLERVCGQESAWFSGDYVPPVCAFFVIGVGGKGALPNFGVRTLETCSDFLCIFHSALI